jgi:hypothetical protein
MQPEPNETPTQVPTQINASELINTSQYGIRSEELHSAGVRDSLHEERLSTDSNPTPNAIGALSSGLQDELRRLSLGDRNDSRPKPSFQRISEYENALTPSPPRKQSEGPGFKIVKKKGHTLDGPQLDMFPNGMSQHYRSNTSGSLVLTLKQRFSHTSSLICLQRIYQPCHLYLADSTVWSRLPMPGALLSLASSLGRMRNLIIYLCKSIAAAPIKKNTSNSDPNNVSLRD